MRRESGKMKAGFGKSELLVGYRRSLRMTKKKYEFAQKRN